MHVVLGKFYNRIAKITKANVMYEMLFAMSIHRNVLAMAMCESNKSVIFAVCGKGRLLLIIRTNHFYETRGVCCSYCNYINFCHMKSLVYCDLTVESAAKEWQLPTLLRQYRTRAEKPHLVSITF